MRIIFTLAITLPLIINAKVDSDLSVETTKLSPVSVPTTKLELKDVRDKRALNDFNAFANLYRHQNANVSPSIQRRISTYGIYPGVQSNRQAALEAAGSNFISNFGPEQYAQQYEAPEPIIEIIIKESNESVPAHPQPVLPPPKKPKEQVQVFYVKYKKDDKTGLQIEDPIPALSPAALNQEEEQADQPEVNIPFVPTLPPITKTTTLRTIIKPDSEVFHSNSGIHVTFNTEDKHQHGHELQENIEESALQPVISSDHFENYVRASPQYQQQEQIQHSSHGDQRSRTFDALNQFNRLQTQNRVHQQNGPPGIYRPSPDQGLLLSYTQHQQNRHYQSQNYDPRLKNSPPVPFFPEPSGNNVPQQHHQLPKYRSQPKPIPIPLRHGDSDQSKQVAHNQGPHSQQQYFTNPQSQHNKPGPIVQYQQPQFRPKQPNNVNHPSFQQYQPQVPGPVQVTKSVQPEQHRFNPVPTFSGSPQPQPQFVSSNGGLFQQRAPNLAPQPNVGQQANAIHQNNNIVQQSHGSTHQNNFVQQNRGEFNRVVTGAELVEALPKFEQHITETVALSEINKPFGRPSQNQLVQPSALFSQYQQKHQVPTQVLQSQPQPQPQPQLQSQSQLIHQQHHVQAEQQQIHHRPAQTAIHQQQPIIQHHPTSHQQAIQHQQSIQHHQVHSQQIQSHPIRQQSSQQTQQVQHIQQQSAQSQTQPQQQPQPQLQQQPQTVHIQTHHHQSQQHQNNNQVSIQQSQEPQIVLPINYHSQNPFTQQQAYQNSIQSQPTGRPSQIHLQEKIVPGKGVSTLATDVFASLQKSQQMYRPDAPTSYKVQSTKYVDTSSRNNVEGSLGPIKSAVPSKTEYVTTTVQATKVEPTTTKPVSSKITAQLPDEVPEDLRQQLLSSGILDNADISILDYDKVGDVPLESLPPEHLANFYGAGGGAQISSSNRVLNIVKPNGDNVANVQYDDGDKSEEKKTKTLPKKQNVDLKVVRFDSNSQKSVADEYIKDDSQVVSSVDINRPYNRYLPLKINGEQFPIPDVESLRNRKISSVVVLAPVDGLHSSDTEDEGEIEDGRFERDIINSKEIKFISGDALKTLLRKPTKEHYKKWLEKEAKTDVDLQSVVLLVSTNQTNAQEIFMYDIASKTVNRLKGELSSAFVDVAEANVNAQDDDSVPVTLTDSGIIEQMNTLPTDNSSDAESIMSFLPEHPIVAKESSVETSATDSQSAETRVDSKVSISSGYSVIKKR